MEKGLEFDPGFAPYVLAFQGTVEYLYVDINRFKNLSQKKIKFRQYYKKILEIFDNNLGFYIGCLMWGAYTKTQPEQKILNNNCLGQQYDSNSNTAETDFMIRFTELFPKDMKYFLSQNYEFPAEYIKILNLYREFLEENKGFVETENNTDIKLPAKLKTKKAEEFKSIIDEILKKENLAEFINYKNLIL